MGSRLDATRPASSLGVLEVEGLDLAIAGDLAIAVVDFDSDAPSAAQGDVELTGDGATLILEMRGLLRGLEYAALDAAQAALDSTLHVFFPDPLPNGLYDLIVSDAPDGIAGDFASVLVTGLGPGQRAHHGVEFAEIGGANVAVYRLRMCRRG